jgi:hypothetical protein
MWSNPAVLSHLVRPENSDGDTARRPGALVEAELMDDAT